MVAQALRKSAAARGVRDFSLMFILWDFVLVKLMIDAGLVVQKCLRATGLLSRRWKNRLVGDAE